MIQPPLHTSRLRWGIRGAPMLFCPYGAPECPGQCSLYGHAIRRMLLNVLHLVHTKQSNVLVTYFYVPKNTYRNIRILKTLSIHTLLFLLKIAVIQMGTSQAIPLSHINWIIILQFLQRPVSLAIITWPTTHHTDHTQQLQSSLVLAKKACLSKSRAPNPYRALVLARIVILGVVVIADLNWIFCTLCHCMGSRLTSELFWETRL